jgi:predicted DNA binding CopG/RHH family protein
MSDELRKPGRPPLGALKKSAQVTVRMQAQRLDELYRRASAQGTTLPALIRRSLDGSVLRGSSKD